MTSKAQTCALTILNILVALHLSRALYKSTLFMQNKPNFRKSQMNVSNVLTGDYENVRPSSRRENKPNQSQKITQKPPQAMISVVNFPLFSCKSKILMYLLHIDG